MALLSRAAAGIQETMQASMEPPPPSPALTLSPSSALHRMLGHVSPGEVELGVGIFLVSLLGSAAAAAFVLCRLPADYLTRDPRAAIHDEGSRVKRLLLSIGRNVLGVLLVLIGIVLSLPGVPGQGVLTILIGVMALDVPGKEKVARKIMLRPSVFRSINKLRARFGKAPLEAGEAAAVVAA